LAELAANWPVKFIQIRSIPTTEENPLVRNRTFPLARSFSWLDSLCSSSYGMQCRVRYLPFFFAGVATLPSLTILLTSAKWLSIGYPLLKYASFAFSITASKFRVRYNPRNQRNP